MNRYVPVEPALLRWQGEAVYSGQFDQPFLNPADGLTQAQQVYVEGSQLQQRWEQHDWLACPVFVVCEAGFGAGINALSTFQAWNQWRTTFVIKWPALQPVLQYVAAEKYPLSHADLQRMLVRYVALEKGLAELVECLISQWPTLTPGLHRLSFDDYGVGLDVWFGDTQDCFEQWDGRAHAWYLDGFSPASNPQMWTLKLFYTLAKKSAPQATVATYYADESVRQGLARARLNVVSADSMSNPDVSNGGVSNVSVPEDRRYSVAPAQARIVAVIGAGMAGVWAAHAMIRAARQQGQPVRVMLIDQASAPAQGASGNVAGAFHPHVSSDDSRLSRLSRMGCEATLKSLQRLSALGLLQPGVDWAMPGHLQLADDAAEEDKFAALVSTLQFPQDALQYVTASQAACLMGLQPLHGGWWFAQGGWLKPVRWLDAALYEVAADLELHMNTHVVALEQVNPDGRWRVDGVSTRHGPQQANTLIADAVVIANAQACQILWPLAGATMSAVKGQVSLVTVRRDELPLCVVSGSAYAIPMSDHTLLLGATYERPGDNTEVTEQAHHSNIERWQRTFNKVSAPEVTGGRSAIRAVWPDRLPVMGRVAGTDANPLFMCTGYASRGITWAVMGGEIIAAQLFEQPPVLVQPLAAAVSATRFMRRA